MKNNGLLGITKQRGLHAVAIDRKTVMLGMYINLVSAKEVEKAKESMLWLGLFMLSGGMAALLNDMVLQEHTRWGWAGGAFLVSLIGVMLVAVGLNKVQLKDPYFSITPAKISYRLSLLGSERMIYWQYVTSIQVSDRYILFDLNSGRQILLRLKAIQSSNKANHIAVSIQTAALKNKVSINGVRFLTPSSI